MAKRIFIYEGKEFDDPDEKMKPDEVRQMYTEFFPELSNASTDQSKRGEDTVFTFKKRVGTKGGAFDSTITVTRQGICKHCLAAFKWPYKKGRNVSEVKCPGCGQPLKRTTYYQRLKPWYSLFEQIDGLPFFPGAGK